MSRGQVVAYRFRWALLVLALLSVGGAITLLLWPSYGRVDPSLMISVAVFLLSQWFFLNPRRGWSLRLARVGRPMVMSVIAGAAVFVMLTLGLAASLLELVGGFGRLLNFLGGYGFWSAVVLIWGFWGIAFFVYGRRGDGYTRLTRMVRWVLGGSIIDLLVAGPTYAFVKDPENCACSRGSFWGLALGITAMLWAFGPGVVLLFLHKRYLALKAFPLCTKCGYDLRASPVACPECGTPNRTASVNGDRKSSSDVSA